MLKILTKTGPVIMCIAAHTGYVAHLTFIPRMMCKKMPIPFLLNRTVKKFNKIGPTQKIILSVYFRSNYTESNC